MTDSPPADAPTIEAVQAARPYSPGLEGVIAGETIAKGTPGGYTLAVATSAVMAIRPTLFKQRPFGPITDFVPISHYVKSPFVFIVNPSLPVHSVLEFIKYAKERPGQISYSSSGIGGAPHLTAELLKQKFGFDMAHVPYRNSPQSIADVAAAVGFYDQAHFTRHFTQHVGTTPGRFAAS